MKHALVFGASGTIGSAVVNRLAYDHNVIACYREQPEQTLHPFIIADLENLNEIMQFLCLSSTKIDTVVNCAGILLEAPVLELEEDSWDKTFNVNLKGAFFLSKFMAEHMIENKLHGNIINIGSFAADMPSINGAAYAASKAGLVSITKSLAAELAQHNIRVNCVSPGVIPSKMTQPAIEANEHSLLGNIALNRFGTGTDVAEAVHYLVNAEYVTGENLKVTGGKFLTQNQHKINDNLNESL